MCHIFSPQRTSDPAYRIRFWGSLRYMSAQQRPLTNSLLPPSSARSDGLHFLLLSLTAWMSEYSNQCVTLVAEELLSHCCNPAPCFSSSEASVLCSYHRDYIQHITQGLPEFSKNIDLEDGLFSKTFVLGNTPSLSQSSLSHCSASRVYCYNAKIFKKFFI